MSTSTTSIIYMCLSFAGLPFGVVPSWHWASSRTHILHLNIERRLIVRNKCYMVCHWNRRVFCPNKELNLKFFNIFRVHLIILQQKVVQEMQALLLMLHRKQKQIIIYDVVLRMSCRVSQLWGKKLLCSLVLQQQILVYLLQGCSKVSRLRLSWV